VKLPCRRCDVREFTQPLTLHPSYVTHRHNIVNPLPLSARDVIYGRSLVTCNTEKETCPIVESSIVHCVADCDHKTRIVTFLAENPHRTQL